LLLHVLEHAAHEEDESAVLWIIDAVHIVRASGDPEAMTARFAEQARAHGLVDTMRAKLETIRDVTTEPRIELAAAGLTKWRVRPQPPAGSRRQRLAEHRRGGAGWVETVASFVADGVDGALARRPRAWAAYVLTGRRPRVEQWLTARGGPLTTTPHSAAPPVGEDGWWDVSANDVCDSLCGPGWSYAEPNERIVWTDGREARLSVPVAGRGPFVVDIECVVLGRHGGSPRRVALRAGGATVQTLVADQDDWLHHVSTPALVASSVGTVELSLLVDSPARPIDLGLGADWRRLGLRLGRVRVRPTGS
ncbi:MAG TPA: hypothetical protein PLV68_15930, partial [Ilumatobacteraceae bacterium]|nr:hypothetical protein [Ilumatobacteraceae bacterium]